MRSTNYLFLRGYVGSDPKAFKDTAKVSIGTNRSWKDDKGEVTEKTDWVTVTILNAKIAKWVMANVKKGDPVYAECRVSESSYEKDGVKIYTTDIIANMFDRLVHKGKDVED